MRFFLFWVIGKKKSNGEPELSIEPILDVAFYSKIPTERSNRKLKINENECAKKWKQIEKRHTVSGGKLEFDTKW